MLERERERETQRERERRRLDLFEPPSSFCFAGSSSVVNPAFRALSCALDEARDCRYPVPAQLTEKCTRGLGAPEKVR